MAVHHVRGALDGARHVRPAARAGDHDVGVDLPERPEGGGVRAGGLRKTAVDEDQGRGSWSARRGRETPRRSNPGGRARCRSAPPARQLGHLQPRLLERQSFQPRPSAAGTGYDATSSGGTNYGPTSQKLDDSIKAAIAAYRTSNGLSGDAEVPADAVTSSASGLDPHISVANALLQAPRVAKARGLPVDKVKALLEANVEVATWGYSGVRVNVLRLNIALDHASAPSASVGK